MEGSTSATEQTVKLQEADRRRAENERLRQELAGKLEGDGGGTPPTAPKDRSGWWRPVVATVLLVLVGLLAPMSVLATWAHDEVGDTDRYVQTVAPLASDPAVQNAIA